MSLFVLAMMLAIPNAASASSIPYIFIGNDDDFEIYESKNLLNKKFIKSNLKSESSSFTLPEDKIAVVYFDLTDTDKIRRISIKLNEKEIYLGMYNDQIKRKNYIILENPGNYLINNRGSNDSHSGEKSIYFYDKKIYKGYISDFNAVMGTTTADLSWTLNNNNDDDIVLFYTDGLKIEELPVTINTKKVTGLEPNKYYTFGLKLQEKSGLTSEIFYTSGQTLLDDVSDLTYDFTHNSVILNWTNPLSITSSDKILIYQDGEKIKELAHNVSSNMINGLEPNTSYIYQVAIQRSDGTITDGDTVVLVTDEEPDDDVPPANITGLNATATENSITLNWTNPIDTDFSHVQIFRDGQLILPNLNDTTYTDVGLTSGTQYVYRIVSVDENGNSSSGVIQTVSTVAEEDNTPPATPQHITVSNGNKSGTVSWVHNLETDLAGYNLYVNGVKVNTGLILGNHYVLTNLDNGTDYNIELTAVDVSGNESDKSQALTITPDEQALPIVETKYDLKAVADGTASWFNGLWLILAFSVAIPLAFLIARRVKALIVGG